MLIYSNAFVNGLIFHLYKLGVYFKLSLKIISSHNDFISFQDFFSCLRTAKSSFCRFFFFVEFFESLIRIHILHVVLISLHNADSYMLTRDWMLKVSGFSISPTLSGRKQWSYQTPQSSWSFNSLQTLHQ